MPQRTLPLVAGEYYHLYNRGHNRQRIFFERENYLFFLRRIRTYLVGEERTSEVSKTSEVWTRVEAYCLMPTHFHMLVCPSDDQLSRRMQRLLISYTKAINTRYGRSGALFQGQFRSAHVDRDEYLLHVSRYIHLNPVAAGLVQKAQDWEFSSYAEYLGLRQGTLPQPEGVLSLLGSRKAYLAFVESYKPGDREVIAHMLPDD